MFTSMYLLSHGYLDMQLTTQQGITAGLETDQTAKLAHIDSLNSDAAALRTSLEHQAAQTEAAQEALAGSQGELTDREAAMAGEHSRLRLMSMVLTYTMQHCFICCVPS